MAAAVLLLGLVASLTLNAYRDSQRHARALGAFNATAQQYEHAVQRQLDVYAAASRSAAAFLSASEKTDEADFARFVRDAEFFTNLKGLRSLGFMPRVAAAERAAFEREMQARYPGFRVRGARPGARWHYPMLYGEAPDNPTLIDTVRGSDFSAQPEFEEAIAKANATGNSAAVFVHGQVREGQVEPLVVTFRPVRPHGAGRHGVVASVMEMRDLFGTVAGPRLSRLLDLEVYEGSAAGRKLMYDAAGDAHAAGAYTYPGKVRYLDRQWHLQLTARPAYASELDGSSSWMTYLAGLVLSALAAYAAYSMALRFLSREASLDLVRKFESFFDNHPFAVYSMDRERRLVHVNQRMADALGAPNEQLVGMAAEHFILPENRKMAAAQFRLALAGHAVAYNNVIAAPNGRSAELSIVLIPIQVGGVVVRVIGFAEDITQRKQFERELYESRQLLQLILDTIPERVFWRDTNSVYLGANKRQLAGAGLERVEQIVGTTDFDLPWAEFAEQYRAEDRRIMESGTGIYNQQFQRIDDAGQATWFDVTKVPLVDGTGAAFGVLGIARDITDQKQMERELEHRANYDSLTGLPNRSLFHTHLGHAIKRCRRDGAELALMFFDIDHFKQINDTWGHAIGDEVIRTVAQRVADTLRESDLLARLGGDEFVLVVEGLASREDAAGVADKLRSAVSRPLVTGAATLDVSTSIGIAFLEPHMSADDLLKRADNAMYDAKRAGRDCYRVA